MMGVMAFTAKLAALAGLSGGQIAFFRFAIGLVPLLAFRSLRSASLDVRRLDLLFYRGLCGSAAVILYFLAIENGSVGIATLLNSTAPVFAGIFSFVFLRERVNRRVLLPTAVALVGVIVVVQATSGAQWMFGRWHLAALGSAVASAGAVVSMRAARQAENSWTIYGSICLFGLVSTFPLAVSQWREPPPETWVVLGAMGVLAIGGQIFTTFSLRWLTAMTIGVIAQLAVLTSMLLGYWLLDEPASPTVIAGALLTIGGVLGVLRMSKPVCDRPIVESAPAEPAAPQAADENQRAAA